MSKLTIVLFLISPFFACSDGGDFHADDIEVFKNTPVWSLAKAIHNGDNDEMNNLINNYPEWLNYKEPKFGITLLFWTIYNSSFHSIGRGDYYEQAKVLVLNGANPYVTDNTGKTSISEAANVHSESMKFIQLCIDSKHTNELSGSLKRKLLSEALIVSSGKNQEEIESVLLLVKAGADINYFNSDSTKTPVSESLIHDNMTLAKYFIVDKGANFDYNIKYMVDRSDWSVLKIIKELDYPKNSKKNKLKQDIFDFIDKNN